MNKTNFNNKTIAREYAFKFLYKIFIDDFKGEKEEIKADNQKLSDAISEFEESYIKEDEEHLRNELNPEIQKTGRELISGYIEKEAEVIDTINMFLEKRSYKSVGNIEKSVLGLGVYELKYLQTPPKVVINEYINLVKAFGPKESFAFINGILDKVSKSL